MDKNAIKKYAIWARRELISRVSQKALQFGISKKNIVDASVDSVNGHLLTPIEKRQRQALIAKIKDEGYEQVMEEVAYTWFNRFIALRFMEVNGYLPSRVRVFTDENNAFNPQILAEAIHLEIDGLNIEKVYAFKDANQTDELYKYLIITQCNALNNILPGIFQRIADYTELLFPDNILREGSSIERMISQIAEDDWKDAVQIIGWLYQYYNTEPKQVVDTKVKKGIKVSKNELPAKTQIFTPDWVVRYMVENSLGRLWVEGHPNNELKAGWKYYLEDAEQELDVQKQLSKNREEYNALTPEQIKCIDPCMGSGHILAYMFDVLMQIYGTYGYSTREAVSSIIDNNLYGLDIDDRAAQLAYFAVMMKARQYDNRFFNRNLQPHVYGINESNGILTDAVESFCKGDPKIKKAIKTIMDELHDAKEYGSILTVTPQDWTALYTRFDEIRNEQIIDIYYDMVMNELMPIVQVAELLSNNYHVVITNPPYLGGGGMSEKLAEYAKNNYIESKNDLFAVFIERGNKMAKEKMFNCVVTMQSWMFLSSYERLRDRILDRQTITALMHMDNQVMGIAFGTAVTVLRKEKITGFKGTYNYIHYSDIANDEPQQFPVADNRFAQVSDSFYRDIPGSPIAYWISQTTRNSFLTNECIGTVAPPKQGLATADNNRFLRLWFEVDINNIGFSMSSCVEAKKSGKRYFPYNKGGAFRRWYGNRDYVVNWENDGYEIKNFKDDKGKVRSRPQNLQYYFKPAITWSDVTSGSFSGRFVEQGFMFDIKGSSGFPKMDLLPYILGLLNSKVAQAFIKILNPTMTTQVGDMTRIPVIQSDVDEISKLSSECIAMAKQDWDSFETSWDFSRHPLVQNTKLIREAYSLWETECLDRVKTIKNNEEDINKRFINIYGLQDEMNKLVDESNITVHRPVLARDIKDLISYSVGCMFGRYSLDNPGLVYAGGRWDGNKYYSFPADPDNIIPICDDEYFEDDILSRFFNFIEVVFGKETLAENLQFIADALGGKGQPKDIIRDYFINEFYSDHCTRYSIIGSGKRPIYWLFDSGKHGGFKALIYMHRYQPDTIARMRTDYVHEQQARYHTALIDLEQRIAGASAGESVKLNKQFSKIQAQDAELREYEEKIHHLADQMIRIDLDDGVKHNYEIFKDVLAPIK